MSEDDKGVIARCVERQPKLYVRGQHEGYYIHSDIADLIRMAGDSRPAPDKLALAVEALELLLPYTDDLEDAGPPGYGWKSDGLSSAISKANQALAAIKAAD